MQINEHSIGFDSRSEFLLPDFGMGKNFISFGVHIDKKKEDALICGKGPTRILDDTTLTAQAQYSTNFSKSNTNFRLSLY